MNNLNGLSWKNHIENIRSTKENNNFGQQIT